MAFTLDDLRRLDFRKVGNWPGAIKLAALAIVLVLGVAGSWWFDWQHQIEAIDVAVQKEATLRNAFIEKKKVAIDLDAYRKQLADIEKSFGTLLRQLPSKSEMEALLTDINQAGLGRGLQFDLFKPNAQETVRDFYAELPISIKITGSYHELGSFASDVAKLSRIVLLGDVTLTTSSKDGATLAMDATARTYRYLDESELQQRRAAQQKAAKK
jgi:type IV pilus assembly protein PilO